MMNKKIFAALSIFAAVAMVPAQTLEFKDKNLEKAVIENFDLNKNGSIDKFEGDQVTNLFLVQKNITSTDDLILFPNAKMIVLDDNAIPNVNLKNLQRLDLFSCTGCKISTFSAENLKSLASLYLDNNSIETFSLKTSPRIDQLTISLNKLKSIDVSSLKYLRKLNVEHNQIQKLDISKNLNLQTLNIGGNKMKETDIKKGAKTDFTLFGAEQ